MSRGFFIVTDGDALVCIGESRAAIADGIAKHLRQEATHGHHPRPERFTSTFVPYDVHPGWTGAPRARRLAGVGGGERHE